MMDDRITGAGHAFDGDVCAACGMMQDEAEKRPDLTCEAARKSRQWYEQCEDREWALDHLEAECVQGPLPQTKAESIEAILASVRRDYATEDERLAFMAKTILDLGAAAGQQRVRWDQERDGLRAAMTAAGIETTRLRRALFLRDASPLALSNDLFAAHLIWAAAQDDGHERPAGSPSIGFAFRVTPQMRQVGADALAAYDEAVGDRGAWAERVYQAMARAAVGALGLIPGKASAKLLAGPERD